MPSTPNSVSPQSGDGNHSSCPRITPGIQRSTQKHRAGRKMVGTSLQSIEQRFEQVPCGSSALVEFGCLSRMHRTTLLAVFTRSGHPGGDSLAFVAPSSAFTRHRAGPSRSSPMSWSVGPRTVRRLLLRLAPPSELSHRAWPGPSSPGIRPLLPLLRHATERPLPGAVAGILRSDDATRPIPFRLCGFAPL
jgi:hypothetical protein